MGALDGAALSDGVEQLVELSKCQPDAHSVLTIGDGFRYVLDVEARDRGIKIGGGRCLDHVGNRGETGIDERRREGETYSDALERILGGDRDLTDGMGFWSGSDAVKQARDVHERGKRKTLDRTG